MLKNLNTPFFFNFLKKNKIIKNFYKSNIVVLKTLQIRKKNIIFDGNLKSECSIKIDEFMTNGRLEIKEGDFVEAFLSNIENRYGNVVLSRIKLKNYIFWKKIFLSDRKKTFIKGNVLKRVKGGYIINIDNFNCFLPFSCSDKKISNVNYYIDKNIYFSIVSFDFKKKNIILSRKVVILKVLKIKRKLFFSTAKPGFLIKGIIKTITNYCVFVDIGYLDCVIHFKNIMWGNYKYSNECFKIGQSIISIILKIDKKKWRIFLGIKQIFNPWKKIKIFRRFIKYGRILRINSYSIYVVLWKNMIAIARNYFKKKAFKFLKVNSYKKISIKKIDYKKKRLYFEFCRRRP